VVSSTFFDTLGVHPALGSLFHGQPDGVSDPAVVVLSDALWRRRYGSDPGIIGRTLSLDDRPYVVIGVLPPEMRLGTLNPDQPVSRDLFQVYVPAAHDDLPHLGPEPDADEQALTWAGYLRMVARLRPGVSRVAATDALVRMNEQIFRDRPGGGTPDKATVLSLRDQLVGPIGPLLLLMLAATGLVLAIAMVNVAISSSSGRSRSREPAPARAMPSDTLIAALVGESLLLGCMAGVLAVPASRLALRAMLALGPATLPEASALPLSGRVFRVSLGAALIAVVGASLVPALRVASTDPSEVLRTAAGRTHRVLARSALLVLQVALALVLLI
jgi:putative ABC transport system permease protein